jgi:hypothetical protein
MRGEDGKFVAGTIIFKMADYGRFVDQGQKGTKSTYKASKKSPYKRKQGFGYDKESPKKSKLIPWIRNKIKRIQDLENGGFVKMTDAKVQSLAFLISRKIKHHGIEATHFFSDPLEAESAKLANVLSEAVGTDYTNAVAQEFETLE